MKKPTSNGVDLYQIGNDYPQAPISAYFDETSYADGIYTKLNKKNLFSGVSSIDGFDDSFFPLKSPSGLNKRILNVQQPFEVTENDVVPSGAVSAVSGEQYFSDEYATADFVAPPVKD